MVKCLGTSNALALRVADNILWHMRLGERIRHGALLASLSVLFIGCASKVSVTRLKQIQDTRGFHTKSLFYVGSSRNHHHFEQFVLFDGALWIPGIESDGYEDFKVPRVELILPATFEFSRKAYGREGSSLRQKIRIKDDPDFRVEGRKTAIARLV